jgi:site-specific recombinase XerD
MEPLRYRSGAYLAGRTSNVLGDLMEESEFRGPDDFLFHRSDGRSVEPKVFREDILYPAMKRAGILVESRATGLHLFRHTAGSLLNKKTADLKRVQVQLGHADIGTTADVYTHVDLETVHQNATDLESIFLEACGGFGPFWAHKIVNNCGGRI